MGHVNRDCTSPKSIRSNETTPEVNSVENQPKIEIGIGPSYIFTLLMNSEIKRRKSTKKISTWDMTHTYKTMDF